MQTMHDALTRIARQRPDAACLCVPPAAARDYRPDGLEWTYGEVAERVAEIAARYRQAGFGHGHTVALMLDNRPEFMLHWLAHNALGICTVPLNSDYQPAEIAYALTCSQSALVVTLAKHAAIVEDGCRRVGAVPVCAIEEFPAALRSPSMLADAAPPGRGTRAGLLFTSGTTGLPKACMLTNDYFFSAGERYRDAGGLMALEPCAERLYNPLPLFYANSFSISNSAMLLTGGCMIFPDRFHPATWWRDVVETRATIIHYLGIIPPVLLAQEPVAEERAHGVRFGVGAGLNPAQLVAFEARFAITLIEVWGMTEVGICTANNHEPRETGIRSMGRPLATVEAAVVDERDSPVADGKPGELVVRCSGDDPRGGFFAGYLGDPEMTEIAWRNGWFHTGDLALRRRDGLFVFVDRIKNMIRRSGQNIAAAEVELVVAAHPGVAEVAVVPVPDELRDEEVMACVVPRPGCRPDSDLAADIVRHTARDLAYFKVPAWVLFVDALPKTSTQKLQRSRLLEADDDPRTRPGCFDLRHLKKRPHARGRLA